jgi:transcriptional antiterminator RfaH
VNRAGSVEKETGSAHLGDPRTSEETTQLAWFCLSSQRKHEHIAARHLRQHAGLEVFLPRIRFQRRTRQGLVWVTEALFPNYLFARFNWKNALRLVHHSPGVSGVVHFGTRWPTIADEVIEELRQLFGSDQLHVISGEPTVGDHVQIAGGVFHGLRAVVTQVMSARERVTVLLEFLGRQTAVELPLSNTIREGDERERVF